MAIQLRDEPSIEARRIRLSRFGELSETPRSPVLDLVYGIDPAQDVRAAPLPDARHIDHIRVGGTDPGHVRRLRILHRAQLVYDIGDTRDLRHNIIAAGVLVESMAAIEGYSGLVVNLSHLKLSPASLMVRVSVDAGESVEQIQVSLALN